ncbi:MAG: glycosyltransferase [Chitinivibrionales bacterium]|nr:glycosyltransferase [Chitinivibrionales bacterium]
MPPSQKKPTILFVNYVPFGDGCAVVLHRTTRYLKSKGYAITVVTPPNEWLEVKAKEDGMTLLHVDIPLLIKFKGPGGYYCYFVRLCKAVAALRKIIISGKYDIIHCNALPNFAPPFAAVICRKPLVWHIHELVLQIPFVYQLFRRLPPLFAGVIICPSKAVQHRFHPKKTIVIPNTIPDEWFDIAQESMLRTKIRRDFGIGSKDKVVLWVGGIAPRKGLDKLLKCFVDYKRINGDITIMVVGPVFEKYRDHYEALRGFSETLPVRVIFTGPVHDPRPFYLTADCVTQTSLLPEAFGLTVLEAMSCGKPVVCSGGGGTAEFVEHDITALVIDPSNIQDLRNAVLSICFDSNKAQRLGMSARERAKNYRASNILPQLEKEYARVMNA